MSKRDEGISASEEDELDSEFLRWLVKQRSVNQKCCLRIFELVRRYPVRWRDDKYFYASQALIGAAFSLWRAVFLGKKTGKRAKILEHSKSFLRTVVLDNAISYPLDKQNNEWTFNYYLESALYRLEYLAKEFPELVPKWKEPERSWERWEYAQELLDKAVENFEKHLKKRQRE